MWFDLRALDADYPRRARHALPDFREPRLGRLRG